MINSISSGQPEKTSRDENFPVASFLLPKSMRGHVMAFYAFARAADDIADSPTFDPTEKIARLDAMENMLLGGGKEGDEYFQTCSAMAGSLRQSNISAIYCRDLLVAFRRDANKNRYASWDELMDYCSFSAAPVGRYLIALAGKGEIDTKSSDALCAALQVLNHLQDMKIDYMELNRVYLPTDWMGDAGASIDELGADKMSQPLRDVTDRAIAGVDQLLEQSKPLVAMLKPGALAREAGGIGEIARQISAKLKHTDPIAHRVELGKIQSIFWFLLGALRG